MLRIKHLLILSIVIIGSFPVRAQQQYKLQHYGGPGTLYLYNRVLGLLPSQEIQKTGDSVVWDISANAVLNTHPTRIVTPAEGIDQFTFLTICSLSGISFPDCFSIWSQTDQALLSNDSLSLFGFTLQALQRYHNKTGNLLLENFFGFTIDLGGAPTPAVIVYQEPDTIFQFPIVYENSWSSSIHWNLDLSATGMNIQYESNQTRTTEVDAWGTLITPYDTFTNVVRLRSEIQHVDTLYTDTITLPVNLTQIEYMWFDTSYKLPIMIATGLMNDTLEIINVIEYIYEATCPTPTWTVTTESNVYYLDSTGSVTVNFTISEPNANVYTWDFADEQIETSTGDISHTYTIAGDIIAVVTGCMTNCLPLNSCSYQTVEFEIIDTVSSVVIVPGEELGIKLYPNPVGEAFTIELPESTGYNAFQIMDLTGRPITRGYLNQRNSVITSETMQNGVYTIHLYKTGEELNRQAVMKFTVIK